jgi:histidinol-phosphate/aromatic aminotransferase/cobyric acid decarboxylase-like protein
MALATALLRQGVIVRPGENLGMPGWIRVSVGTSDDLDWFEEAINRQPG